MMAMAQAGKVDAALGFLLLLFTGFEGPVEGGDVVAAEVAAFVGVWPMSVV